MGRYIPKPGTEHEAHTFNGTLITSYRATSDLGIPSQGYFKLVEPKRDKIEINSKEKIDLWERRDEIRFSKGILSVQALWKEGHIEGRSERVEEWEAKVLQPLL